jgi:hypothetical protein
MDAVLTKPDNCLNKLVLGFSWQLGRPAILRKQFLMSAAPALPHLPAALNTILLESTLGDLYCAQVFVCKHGSSTQPRCIARCWCTRTIVSVCTLRNTARAEFFLTLRHAAFFKAHHIILM